MSLAEQGHAREVEAVPEWQFAVVDQGLVGLERIIQVLVQGGTHIRSLCILQPGAYITGQRGERVVKEEAGIVRRDKAAPEKDDWVALQGDSGRVLGFSYGQVDRLAKAMNHFEYVDDGDGLARHMASTGLDPNTGRVRLFARLWQEMQDLPRHLGQHSGGMVICQGRLDSVVPLENASMPGRVVVQWDKDDCADMGIVKVDLLGLGMMAALQEAIVLVNRPGGGSDGPTDQVGTGGADGAGGAEVEGDHALRGTVGPKDRNALRRALGGGETAFGAVSLAGDLHGDVLTLRSEMRQKEEIKNALFRMALRSSFDSTNLEINSTIP